MLELTFVLEQTLGHVAHGLNLERVLAQATDVEGTVVRLPFSPPHGPMRHTPLARWSWRASLAARGALLARLEEGRLDGVFIHTQTAALLSRSVMRRVPTVVSLDAPPRAFDMMSGAYRHGIDAGPLERAKTVLHRHTYGAAAALVSWSRWAAASLVGDYGVAAEKIHVIPPGVDTRRFTPRPRREGAALRVLFVGGDFDRKGGPDLLEALRLMSGGVELDIVTASPLHVAGLPSVRVHHGVRPQTAALIELYQAADVLALPTHGDCFAQVIAEGLACGLPVVTTPMGAIPEMVHDGVTGLLVPARDPVRLAAALDALARDSALRRRMGEAAVRLAAEEHDADRNNRRILDLVATLAARGRRERRAA
ncbi:MAG: glycosyltransferase family 4 protein [Candidatus Dormibacteraceae bacterium]